MNARKAYDIAANAFQEKTDRATEVIIVSIDGDILREAKMGWFEVNIDVAHRASSLHLSFNEGIIRVIMAKVKRHYESQGYHVLCNARGECIITISWGRVM